MQYQVPQFIEVEDKIFGPLTFRQFIYIGGSAGIIVILFFTMPNFIAFILSIPFAALGGALAFVKINERPFVEVLESAFFFMTGGKLYLWKKKEGGAAKKEVAEQAPVQKVTTPPPQEALQKIRSLAWSLDIQDQQKPPYAN